MTLTFDLGGHRDCRLYASWYFVRVPGAHFGDTTTIRFRFMAIGPTQLRPITWPYDLDLWPWRSWRLWLMQVVVIHPCAKFEVRRPCHSEDMAHDVCQQH